MELYGQGRQPREEVSQEVDTEPQEKKNLGIGAEEKVQRGKILVEKHSDESEDTVYSMGKWEITVDFLPDSGPQGIYE